MDTFIKTKELLKYIPIDLIQLIIEYNDLIFFLIEVGELSSKNELSFHIYTEYYTSSEDYYRNPTSFCIVICPSTKKLFEEAIYDMSSKTYTNKYLRNKNGMLELELNCYPNCFSLLYNDIQMHRFYINEKQKNIIITELKKLLI